ncbi:MAG: Holliday junction branch migration protein RuvA, partial [Prevotella sp.]|nr:Holliday junction branch migration protein RuvA [Prevotella sp.]
MISYLRGKLLELNDNGAVIDVNGVGYEVVLA